MTNAKIRSFSAKGSKIFALFVLTTSLSLNSGNCAEPTPIDHAGLMSIGLEGGLSAEGDYVLSENITLGTFGELSSAAAYIDSTFRGTLDGGGYTIENLDRPLFYKIEGNVGGEGADKVSDYAEVRNLILITSGLGISSSDSGVKARGVLANDITFTKLIDIQVEGLLKVENMGAFDNDFASIGGLVGSATNSYVTNCDVEVEVFAPEMIKVGGLIGSATATNILDSSATGDVYGTRQVGGLVGVLGNSTITYSSATGDVIASNEGDGSVNPDEIVGGLVGRAAYSSITGSVAEGDVTGRTDVGGLVGMMDHSVVINTKVSNASVVTGISRVGGFVGYSMYDEISGSESAATVVGTDPETTGSFIGVQILSEVKKSFSIEKSELNLSGKSRESIVTDSYSFKIADNEKFEQLISFIREAISENLIQSFLLDPKTDVPLESRVGKPLSLKIIGDFSDDLGIYLRTPEGEWIFLGQLELKDGQLILPTLSFDASGTYSIKIIENKLDVVNEIKEVDGIVELNLVISN